MSHDDALLFADFDGVLGAAPLWAANEHRRGTCPAGWLDPVLIAHLNRLVRRTRAGVVLSTAWRCYLGPEAARGALVACGFTGRVVGATPLLGAPAGHAAALRWLEEDPKRALAQRHREIEAWRRANAPRALWVGVDDCELALPPEHFVRTHAAVGLTEADAERIEALFAAQASRR